MATTSDILNQLGIGALFGADQQPPADPNAAPPSLQSALATKPAAPAPAATIPAPAAPAPAAAPSLAGALSSAPPAATKPQGMIERNAATIRGAADEAKQLYDKALTPPPLEQVNKQNTAWLDNFKQVNDSLLTQAKADPEYSKYSDTIKKADNAIANARAVIGADRQNASWLGAIEKIGQALATYAAARYGRDKGLDVVGGMKLEPTDWNKMIAGSVQDMRDAIEQELHERDMAMKGQEKVEGAYREEAARRGQVFGQQQQLSDQLERERKMKQADIGLQEAKEVVNANLQGERYDALAARYGANSPANKMANQQALLDYKNIDKKIDGLNKAQAALSLLDSKSLSNKATQDKLLVDVNKAMGQAGLDPASAQQETGLIIKTLQTDPARARDMIQQRIQELDGQRQQLRQRGTASPAAAVPATPTPTATAAATPTSGKQTFTRDQAAAWASQHGMTPEKAIEVLTSRGGVLTQ